MTSARVRVKSAGGRRALVPDDGHENALHWLEQQHAHQSEEQAHPRDGRPHGPFLFENDPVKNGRRQMTGNQHGCPGRTIISPHVAPIDPAGWTMFDGLQKGPEQFCVPAIWTPHLQTAPKLRFQGTCRLGSGDGMLILHGLQIGVLAHAANSCATFCRSASNSG